MVLDRYAGSWVIVDSSALRADDGGQDHEQHSHAALRHRLEAAHAAVEAALRAARRRVRLNEEHEG